MKLYIRSISGISPGSAPGAPVIPVRPETGPGKSIRGTGPDSFAAIEPDYGPYFDAKQIRRTSRIVRMGVTAALHCLRQAGKDTPEAIITGTAYGCLGDTEVFLERLIRQGEEMLSPTAFIQSTHNTAGAQIALLLQCTAYNNTFVHRGHSFESALLDATLLLADGEAQTVLAGAVDEITPASHTLLQRFGLCRHHPIGEGAFFFLLAAEAHPDDWARLDGLHTITGELTEAALTTQINAFLATHALTLDDIDQVLLGTDRRPASLDATRCAEYKIYCGDYPTASSFALGWAASEIKNKKARHILVCHSWLSFYHSFLLVTHAE